MYCMYERKNQVKKEWQLATKLEKNLSQCGSGPASQINAYPDAELCYTVFNGVQSGRPGELGPEGFPVAAHLRAGLLRRRDDAHCRAQIRHGQVCTRLAMSSVILYFAAL
jgi:hypothetical protein